MLYNIITIYTCSVFFSFSIYLILYFLLGSSQKHIEKIERIKIENGEPKNSRVLSVKGIWILIPMINLVVSFILIYWIFSDWNFN